MSANSKQPVFYKQLRSDSDEILLFLMYLIRMANLTEELPTTIISLCIDFVNVLYNHIGLDLPWDIFNTNHLGVSLIDLSLIHI